MFLDLLRKLRNKSFKADFLGINTLFLLVFQLIMDSSNKTKLLLMFLVGIYLLALASQAIALLIVFLSIRNYVSTQPTGVMVEVSLFLQSFDLEKTELLFLLVSPAVAFLFIASKLLSKARIDLVSLSVKFKEQYERSYLTPQFCDGENCTQNFAVQLNGIFGVVRALLLNSFVFLQTAASLVILLIIEPLIAVYLVFCIVAFFVILLFARVKKPSKQPVKIEQLDEEDFADEEMSIAQSPSSFNRTERMRLLGRNYGYFVVASSFIIGIIFDLGFMERIDKFALVGIILRYVPGFFVPVAVIGNASKPFRRTMVLLINIRNLIKTWQKIPSAKSEEIMYFICETSPYFPLGTMTYDHKAKTRKVLKKEFSQHTKVIIKLNKTLWKHPLRTKHQLSLLKKHKNGAKIPSIFFGL